MFPHLDYPRLRLELGWRVLRAGRHKAVRWAMGLSLGLSVILVLMAISGPVPESPPLPPPFWRLLGGSVAIAGLLMILINAPYLCTGRATRKRPQADPLRQFLAAGEWEPITDADRDALAGVLFGPDHAAITAAIYGHLARLDPTRGPHNEPMKVRYNCADLCFSTPRTPQRSMHIAPKPLHLYVQHLIYHSIARQHGVVVALGMCDAVVPFNAALPPSAHAQMRARALDRDTPSAALFLPKVPDAARS